MSEWQPIETAPKDDDLILLYLEGSGVRPGYWDDDQRWDDKLKRYVEGNGRWLAVESQCLTGGGWQTAPTHWMPLPDPPVSGTVVDAKPSDSTRRSEAP